MYVKVKNALLKFTVKLIYCLYEALLFITHNSFHHHCHVTTFLLLFAAPFTLCRHRSSFFSSHSSLYHATQPNILIFSEAAAHGLIIILSHIFICSHSLTLRWECICLSFCNISCAPYFIISMELKNWFYCHLTHTRKLHWRRDDGDI